MCEGYFIREQKKELSELRKLRSLSWTIVCGYADPKKLPANQMEWWPIGGDVVPKKTPKKITKARVKKIEDLAAMHLAKLNSEGR